MMSPERLASDKVGWTVPKNKKKRKASHEQHHAAIHQYIVRKRVEDGEIEGVQPEHHVLPTHQNWHAVDAACPCFPRRIGMPDPQTGVVVWLHSGWIH